MLPKQYKRSASLLLIITAILFSLSSCSKKSANDREPSNPDPIKIIKDYLYEVMTNIYYWYKEVPDGLNVREYKSVDSYFYDLLVPVDRWSWMMTGKEFVSSETGVVKSYGIAIGQPLDYYNDYAIKVRYVHPNSPMAEGGVKRGWELTHLNGTEVMSLIIDDKFESTFSRDNNRFSFINLEGSSVELELEAREINTRSVLMSEIYGPEHYPSLTKKVGYLHYLSFKGKMLDDIDDAMALFKSEGVEDLILDLRYNGGGDDNATVLLASYIAPTTAYGKVLAKREHNDLLSDLDDNEGNLTVIRDMEGEGLNLNRLFVITSGGSASASEVIINGLNPFMEVIQIGSTTYGKPNGMYVMTYPANNTTNPLYVFLPVAFFTVNSLGDGDYLDGIEPNHYRPDDLYHNFGPEEECIKAALHYIANGGAFPDLPPVALAAPSLQKRGKITLPEEREGYGLYTLPLIGN